MCVSAQPAIFKGTRIYHGIIRNGVPGFSARQLTAVGIYSNNAQSLAGPNAMLLAIPTLEPMTERNFLDTTQCPRILDDMVRALTPQSKSLSMGMRGGGDDSGVLVFDVGLYTMVVAPQATQILGALNRVRLDRRPTVNGDLLEFYDLAYPGWSIVLCCFNNAQAKQSGPVMFWYLPIHGDNHYWPALDCHTGDAPDIHEMVDTDHFLIASSDRLEAADVGAQVYYTDDIPAVVRQFLPNQVVGGLFQRHVRNGDFVLPASGLLRSRFEPERRSPPFA